MGKSIEAREHWCSPSPGWVKLNTDSAFSHLYPGFASGGVLRDENGAFVKAFKFKGQEGDYLTAELWGCLLGLKLSWDLGFKKVVLESDSADAIDLIRSPLNEAHADRGLVEELKVVVDRNWNVEVRLISRRINAAADQLVKSGLSSMPGFQVVSHPDMVLTSLLDVDKC